MRALNEMEQFTLPFPALEKFVRVTLPAKDALLLKQYLHAAARHLPPEDVEPVFDEVCRQLEEGLAR